MTADDKRERRQARHEAQNGAYRLLNRSIGLSSTAAQVRAAARKLSDRVVSQALNPNG